MSRDSDKDRSGSSLTRRKLHSTVGAVIMGLVDAIGEILGCACAFRRVLPADSQEKKDDDLVFDSDRGPIYHPAS